MRYDSVVVIVPVPDKILATLAENFIQHVLLEVGICHLLILDDGSPYKGFFIAMCMGLNINHNILAKRNHNFFLFQKNHRFINKLITSVAEDRGTNGIFEAAGVAAGYAWNSLPINGTNILRSDHNIGRELPFPLDFDSSVLPAVVSNNAEFVVSYLRLIDSIRYFASTILKSSLRIEELFMQKGLIIIEKL